MQRAHDKTAVFDDLGWDQVGVEYTHCWDSRGACMSAPPLSQRRTVVTGILGKPQYQSKKQTVACEVEIWTWLWALTFPDTTVWDLHCSPQTVQTVKSDFCYHDCTRKKPLDPFARCHTDILQQQGDMYLLYIIKKMICSKGNKCSAVSVFTDCKYKPL